MHVALFLGLLAAADLGELAPDADAPTVGASLDRTEAHVGDRLTLTLSAVAKAGVAVTLANKLDLGKLELLDRADGEKGGRDLGDGRRAHRFVIGVAAYELGDLEIPSIELSYINPRGEVRTAKTEPITVHVRPLVPSGIDEDKPEVQPLRPPREAMVEDKRVMKIVRWAAVGLGGALVLGLIALFVRRALRKREVESALVVPAVLKRPADEVAMEKLGALRKKGQFAADGYRPFYFAVAEIVREYLGARYGFDSLELTTTELLDQLNQRAAHLTPPDSAVVKFLTDTDLVKFARTGSTDAAANQVIDAAQSIILSTAAPLEEAAKSISGPVRLPRENAGG